MSSYLEPIEKPKGIVLKMAFWFSRRMFGMVPRPFSVFCARMPRAFMSFFGKVSTLDKKLNISPELVLLVRERTAATNMCTWCTDAERWFAAKKQPRDLPKLDAIEDYRTSPLFSDAERAAMNYAVELTRDKRVSRETFNALAVHYSERQICDIVWCVASEHLYNINNLGLNISSDGLCDLAQARTA